MSDDMPSPPKSPAEVATETTTPTLDDRTGSPRKRFVSFTPNGGRFREPKPIHCQPGVPPHRPI